MKKYILIILLGGLISCQKEELSPSRATNPFAPNPEATDETSLLRQEFLDATGCFLLFNDTLRHEYQGTDVYGVPYYDTETIDLAWNLDGITTYTYYTFRYLETIEQQRDAMNFLQSYLLPYMENIMPYSILAVNGIDQYDTAYGTPQYESSPLTASNSSCLAINLNQLWSIEDKESYAQSICIEIIFANWGGTPPYYEGSSAAEFFETNRWQYGYPKMYYLYGDMTLEDLGFIEDTNETLLPTAKEDAVAYIKACLSMTEEAFYEKYAAYPVILEKYEIVKPLVDETGIQF